MVQLRLSPSGREILGVNNGDTLVWNSALQTWEPGPAAPATPQNLAQTLTQGNSTGGQSINVVGGVSQIVKSDAGPLQIQAVADDLELRSFGGTAQLRGALAHVLGEPNTSIAGTDTTVTGTTQLTLISALEAILQTSAEDSVLRVVTSAVLLALNSGRIEVITGNAVNGNTGAIDMRSGDSTAGDSGDINILTGSAGGTRGDLSLQGLVWPAADGNPGDILSTDGAGNLSWIAP